MKTLRKLWTKRKKNKTQPKDVAKGVAIPASQPAPRPPSPPLAYILKLLPDHANLLLRITTFLDYPSIVIFSLTCKALYSAIPIPALHAPTPAEELAILRELAPTRRIASSRFPLHFCTECLIWHSFEYLVVYPHPRPERVFLSDADFAVQNPRVCVRAAIASGRWAPGGWLEDRIHILCAKCRTPRNVAERECSWNCVKCRRCTGRKNWGGVCVVCWRPGHGDGVSWRTNFAAELRMWRPQEEDIVKSEPGVARLYPTRSDA